MPAPQLFPKALPEAQAREYIGATAKKFAALKRIGRIKPLPATGSYSVKHLDRLIAEEELKLETAPKLETKNDENVILLTHEGNAAQGRPVHDPDPHSGPKGANRDLRQKRGGMSHERERSAKGGYPNIV